MSIIAIFIHIYFKNKGDFFFGPSLSIVYNF